MDFELTGPERSAGPSAVGEAPTDAGERRAVMIIASPKAMVRSSEANAPNGNPLPAPALVSAPGSRTTPGG